MIRHGAVVLLAALAVAMLCAGCASPPPAERPDLGVVVPETWTARRATDDTTGARVGWWHEFDDETLDDLILEALHRNRDLRAAAERVQTAAAQVRITGADAWPQLGLRYDAAREKRTFVGLPIPGSGGAPLVSLFSTHGLSLDVSWEVDLWGRVRAGKIAALADEQSALADYHGAAHSIVGQTTKAWFTLVESHRQVELAEAAVASYRGTLEQVEARYTRGLRPSLDVRLAESNLAGAEADLESRRGTLDRARRQVELLLGRYPAGDLETVRGLPTLPAAIPGGLPSELVGRRPDLATAERRLAAAGARVDSARRALYPRISLSASDGASSSELSDLLDGDFSVWRLAGNVFQPLFQGGRLLAGIDLAEARQREALESYVGVALRAYSEVESTLPAETFLTDAEAALRRQVVQAKAAVDLARSRYDRGLDDVITLLTTQLQAVRSESRLLATQRLRLENRVDLYLALGGGFDRTDAFDETDEVAQRDTASDSDAASETTDGDTTP